MPVSPFRGYYTPILPKGETPSGRLTGFTWFSARRVKCDETRPVCKRCITADRECRGYSIALPLPNRETISQLWISGRQEICAEPEPPDWDLTEALNYYYMILKPGTPHQPDPDTFHPHFIPSRFICQMMADQISKASKARNRLIGPGEDPAFAGLWLKFHHHMAKCLEIINQTIRGEGKYDKVQIIFGILYLVYMDIYQKVSMWHTHIRGFLEYLGHMGGPEVSVQDAGARICTSIIFMLATPLNTTTPARKQITGFDCFTDAQLLQLFGNAAIPDMPCPAEIFIAIVYVTRLRGAIARAENGSAIDQDLTLSIDSIPIKVKEIFDNTQQFDVSKWAEDLLANNQDYWSPEHSPGSADALLPMIGEIFCVAVRLYGILALPEWAVESWASSASDMRAQTSRLTSCESAGALHRQALLVLLRKVCGQITHDEGLAWPLVVAGVAVADGSADERAFVERCLWNVWRLPNTVASFALVIDKLGAFWRSGKTRWEDCFDEPTQCAPLG
ncbi:hypothetical protein NLG97_g10236 [Lecanicillium saksenae]|uniref:Uncharacterized protein n=1 Tax=Lecanicillium saksenae TaxID=468837 RepID=A0ACC1QFL0_9HYPO|nr:hypothetical protein NLG97_g10236 [Lecanicillium saksenae]